MLKVRQAVTIPHVRYPNDKQCDCGHDFSSDPNEFHLERCKFRGERVMFNDYVQRVLDVYAMFPNDLSGDELIWRTDGKYSPVTFMILCSDFFDYGTADLEVITPENVYLL